MMAIIKRFFQDGFTGSAAKCKHGRFSLQACIGYFVREYSKLGGYLSPSMGIKLSEGPDRLVAFSTVPLAGWI